MVFAPIRARPLAELPPEELAVRTDAASARARIMRVISIVMGASGILFILLLWRPVLDQWHSVANWWNIVTLATAALVTTGAIWAGLAGRVRHIRIAAAVLALSYVMVLLLQIVALIEPVSVGSVPWLLTLAAVAAAGAALAFRPSGAWLYLVVAGMLTGVVRWLAGAEQSPMLGLQNAVQTIAFCAIFVIIVQSLSQAGASADRAIVTARRESSAEASRRARHDVSDRINALIHDRVLATLLLAGRATTVEERASAARSAADALAALERQRDEDDVPLTATQLVWSLQGLVRDTDPETQFGYDVVDAADGSPGEVSGEVCDAIAAATLEALRNSLRHADRPEGDTTRAVHIDASVERIRVTVLDDGIGFEPERVAPVRLGIASSIRGRMDSVGGVAQLVSIVGQGTRVVLTWDRAEAAAVLAERERDGVAAARPWRTRSRVSPLDLDFWIGPPIGADVGAAQRPLPRTAPTPIVEAAQAPVDARDTSREARARLALPRRFQREPLLVFVGLQVLSNVILAFTSDPARAASWPSVTALVLYVLAGAFLVLPGATPLRCRYAIVVALATTAITVLMSMVLPHVPGYFAWHFGANTLILLGLALRGRIRLAWAGMILMLGLTIALVRDPLLTPVELFGLFDRNVATLFVGTVAALALKRSINRTLSVERAMDARAASEAAAAAAASERERILQRFEASALPVLREIAAGSVPDDATRREWLATEAELRDRIRARALDVEPLRSAVQRARERGLRVVVLDDTEGRHIVADELLRALAWASAKLDAETSAEVTVRLRPVNDRLLLTIVGEHESAIELGVEPETAALTGESA